jgi:hypothetical protein
VPLPWRPSSSFISRSPADPGFRDRSQPTTPRRHHCLREPPPAAREGAGRERRNAHSADAEETGKTFSARNFRENRKSRFSLGSGYFPYRSNFSAVLNLAGPIQFICIWAVNKRPKILLMCKYGTLKHLQPPPASQPPSCRRSVFFPWLLCCSPVLAFFTVTGRLQRCRLSPSRQQPSARQICC